MLENTNHYKQNSPSILPVAGVIDNKKFFIKTLGCQMNEYDSTMIGRILEQKGYTATKTIEEAWLLILNTCSVRKSAEDKAFSYLGLLNQIKKKNPEVIIIVVGCMAQRLEKTLMSKFPCVDIILGTQNLSNLSSIVTNFISSKQKTVLTKPVFSSNTTIVPKLNKEEKILKSFVTIMRGCSNFCSYCIVPYVRGEEKSKPLERIIGEIKDLAGQGCKEVTLLGQNVNSYYDARSILGGVDYNFVRLLERINEINGIERIRFTTSHPKDMNKEIIFAVKNLSKLCEHIHLPVQHGSNKILQKMKRGYTREEYIKLAQKIRKEIPQVSISTDIMVGYPQETEEDFNEILSLVKEISFDAAYTFKYSPRPGTQADNEEDNVCREEKESRLARLMELCRQQCKEQNQKMIGKTEEVLIERKDKHNPNKMVGRTRNNKVVIFEAEKELIGDFVDVEINDAHIFSLMGKIKNKKQSIVDSP